MEKDRPVMLHVLLRISCRKCDQLVSSYEEFKRLKVSADQIFFTKSDITDIREGQVNLIGTIHVTGKTGYCKLFFNLHVVNVKDLPYSITRAFRAREAEPARAMRLQMNCHKLDVGGSFFVGLRYFRNPRVAPQYRSTEVVRV